MRSLSTYSLACLISLIGQCQCVSKPWRALLSTPQFIKSHLTRIRELSEESVSLITYLPSVTCLTLSNAHHLFDEITASARRLSFAAYPYSCTKINGSCDGLVLVGDKKHSKLLINPTTREIREVPILPLALNIRANYITYGLGYDSVNDDYKVAVIHKLIPGYTDSFVRIYSVNNGTWKRCESSLYDLDLDVEHLMSGIFVEKCVNCMARRTADRSIVIVAFNVEEEKFYEVPIHGSIDPDSGWFHYLEVLAGCLCICSNHFDVWMMKEYGIRESWTELAKFESKGSLFMPLCLLGQENLVLMKY